MHGRKYQVPYGKSTLEFTLPPTMQAAVCVSRHAKPLEDVPRAIRVAFEHPIATRPLPELAKPGNRVCTVFNDVIRASPINGPRSSR